MTIKFYEGAGVFIREGLLLPGEKIKKHVHTYDHLSILGMGRVLVEADGVVKAYDAPAVIKIKAGIEHKVMALTMSTWYCVHQSDIDAVDDLSSVIITKEE